MTLKLAGPEQLGLYLQQLLTYDILYSYHSVIISYPENWYRSCFLEALSISVLHYEKRHIATKRPEEKSREGHGLLRKSLGLFWLGECFVTCSASPCGAG